MLVLMLGSLCLYMRQLLYQLGMTGCPVFGFIAYAKS
jgi:hypothetical protein